MSLAAQIARSLEEGRGGPIASAVAELWGAMAGRALVKPLNFPADRRLVVVGGGTLGGSGKTPLAIECARYLASIGELAALIGHAHGAAPGEPHVVSLRDHVSYVGDESLVAGRALAPRGVPVIVAPTRQGALDLAFARARVAVVDGVAQTAPVRAHLALLAVDARKPWGAGACPPRGDLRAPRGTLVSACDGIVAIGDDTVLSNELSAFDRPIHQVGVVAGGAWLDGQRLDWAALRRRRVGLWTSVARPTRILDLLARERIAPRVIAAHADHSVASTAETTVRARQAAAEKIDLWLCTAKCAVHLPHQLEQVPVAVLEYELSLGTSLRRALRAAVER